MNTYVALLRGINVGGRNSLPMLELVELLHGMGLQNIKTYIQSGNVIFQSEQINASELSDRMSLAINESHGFAPQVIVLELAELETAIVSNPFPEGGSEPKTLHLYFLASRPENPDLEALERVKRESERYSLKGKIFYLYAPDGIGRSKLAERIEKSIGVAVTARNWRTVSKVLAMAKQNG